MQGATRQVLVPAGRRSDHFPHAAGVAVAAFIAALCFSVAIDIAVRPRGRVDDALTSFLRRHEPPGFEYLLDAVAVLTASPWEVLAWAAAFTAFMLSRRWLEAFAIAVIAAVDAAALVLSWVVDALDGNLRFASFSSVHVFGAVLLYSFLAVAAARASRRARYPVFAFSAAVILLAGFERVWAGSDSASEVLAAWSIGGLCVTGLAVAYGAMRPTLAGIPFIHAAAFPHEESVPHAHALTSTLLFENGRVYKMYAPGFVPRLIYWLSFQAPFAYSSMPRALEAAVHRRNLAGLLTEYWYGERRVSPAYGWTVRDGHLALEGHFLDGHQPSDHDSAQAFLFDISARFDEAGLPTWQIDPRQPRSLGNILETEPGKYTVIDLESGLVSPMASPRAWRRAFRRGLVPLYDDVYFDITRKYVERESASMRASLGDAWYTALLETLAQAERATDDWHRAEPRIWGHIARGAQHGFGVPAIPRRIHDYAERDSGRARSWIESAIETWRSEGRLTAGEADRLRAELDDPGVAGVIPHFGVHLAIGIVLRFPFGSITRASYTLLNLLVACARLLLRRIDRRAWRRSVGIHAPWVVLAAALPGVGTFAYLTSVPVLSHFLLARVVADAVGEKLPFHVYRRLGFKRLVARQPRAAEGAAVPR